MSRWSNCPGSVRLSEGIPKTTSSYAEEGTLAHAFAEEWLRSGLKDPPAKCDAEMAENIKIYVEKIRQEYRDADRVYFEHRFDISRLHPGLFGTADCVLYFEKTKTLKVFDLKYGAGVPVEAVGNVQLQYYGLGAMLSLGLVCKDIELTIVQPRCAHEDGPIRTWAFEAVTMIDFMADLLEAALATEKPDAPLVAGSHCKFCPAAGVCPELKAVANVTAAAEFAPSLSYDPVVLSQTLERLPLLETWVKGVREFAYSEAERGRVIPGWKLVDKRPTRKWANEEVVFRDLALHTALAFDDIHDVSIKSPAQIEKLLPKEHRKILETLEVKVSSGKTLVPTADKRPGVAEAAVLDFAGAV